MGKYKKISELAREAGLADSTARRYLEQFSEFFPSKREGRTRFYLEEGADTLKDIARLFSQGLTAPQVRDMLQEIHSKTIEVEEEAFLTQKNWERELQSRERLTQVLENLADQKEKLLELDRKGQALTDKSRELEREVIELKEKEIADLKERLDKLEQEKDEDPRSLPWWKRIFKMGQGASF